MVALSDADLRVIVGPDYKRIMSTKAEVDTTSTPAEHAAARASRISKLSDMNFTFYAVMFTGACLIIGANYSGAGLTSVQSYIGFAFIAIGLGGVGYNMSRKRAILAERDAAS